MNFKVKKVIFIIKNGFLRILPIWSFFFISFLIMSINRSILSSEYGIPFYGFSRAFLGALVMSKVLVIFDHIYPMERFHKLPLIFPIIKRSFLYLFALIVIESTEKILENILNDRSLVESSKLTFKQMYDAQFLTLGICLLVLIFGFLSLRELVKELGHNKVIHMFFGKSFIRNNKLK